MNVKFNFFDNEEWSVYATIKTVIPIILLYIFNINLDLKTLTLSSLIGMMSGDITSKIIFYIFLSLLIFKKEINFIYTNFIFILSIIIIHFFIPYDNNIKIYILKNKFMNNIFRLIILIWFLYFFYLLFKL
jgi:hypothetical protein